MIIVLYTDCPSVWNSFCFQLCSCFNACRASPGVLQDAFFLLSGKCHLWLGIVQIHIQGGGGFCQILISFVFLVKVYWGFFSDQRWGGQISLFLGWRHMWMKKPFGANNPWRTLYTSAARYSDEDIRVRPSVLLFVDFPSSRNPLGQSDSSILQQNISPAQLDSLTLFFGWWFSIMIGT